MPSTTPAEVACSKKKEFGTRSRSKPGQENGAIPVQRAGFGSRGSSRQSHPRIPGWRFQRRGHRPHSPGARASRRMPVMGLRYRRRVTLFPGFGLNFGRSGLTSVSVGGRGAHYMVGKRSSRATVGLPGTGLSYTVAPHHHRGRRRPAARHSSLTPSFSVPTNKARSLLSG
jgi:hypothetical protein